MRHKDSETFQRAAEQFAQAEIRASEILAAESKLVLAHLYKACGNFFDWRPSIIEAELRALRRELENSK